MAVIPLIKKKRKRGRILALILILLVLILAGACAAALLTAQPHIVLQGESQVELEVFSPFTPAEAKATLTVAWMEFPLETLRDGVADPNTVGSYTITHRAQFLKKEVSVAQTVTFTDTTAPMILPAADSLFIEYDVRPMTAEDVELEFTATDNYDGDLTDQVVRTLSEEGLTLSVTDAVGNPTSVFVPITITDSVAPVLSLQGFGTVHVPLYGTFSEPGFSASDNRDGDLSDQVTVSGSVNTGRPGTYTLNYTVADEAGNTTSLSRQVVVFRGYGYGPGAGTGQKTVYLTFDDGPGAYTAKLLNYLDRYGVKATFFVTNQFPSYQHLIGEMSRRGHAVGVHTTTHEWSIYRSTDNYYNDFNTMQDIIRRQTGSEVSIFRFPGGTSNTVSCGQCKGIMTRLSREMKAAGFLCFDWNVDSTDCSTTNTQSIIDATIDQISRLNNAIVLMHDIKNYSVEAVPAIIEWCLENGYTFAVLDGSAPACQFRPNN